MGRGEIPKKPKDQEVQETVTVAVIEEDPADIDELEASVRRANVLLETDDPHR